MEQILIARVRCLNRVDREPLPSVLRVHGLPPYVESWAVAKVPGFVLAILNRWRRAHPDLAKEFFLIMCPVAEVNALGGLPAQVHELIDPRLSCRHFTGCSRPYYAMILSGPSAAARRLALQAQLPWSESYRVRLGPTEVELSFVDASEALEEPPQPPQLRSLADKLDKHELLKILA